jgi:hypothetical protein
MGLGDWVRVVSRFASEAGFGGVGQQRSRKSSLHGSAVTTEKSGITSAQWQPNSAPGEEGFLEKSESSTISDDLVETLAQDIQACILLYFPDILELTFSPTPSYIKVTLND